MAIATDADEPLHVLTVDDYHRMIEVGILGEDDQVELLEGALIAMSPEGPSHAATVDRLAWWSIRGLPEERSQTVRLGAPVTLPPHSEPQPGLAVVDAADSNFSSHPGSAHLVIEVAKTSLSKDRVRKARIYAEAGLPLYWIVDLRHRSVIVHRHPTPDGYREIRTVEPPAMLDPGICDLPPLDLAALFAPD
jgi:Uma2 family endonuclease